MANNYKISWTVFIAVIFLVVLYFGLVHKNNNGSVLAPQVNQTNSVPLNANEAIVNEPKNTEQKNVIAEPISNALNRVTKKPFGIKISPSNSPVSPEKFSGYHTGVDFETLASEQDSDVAVFAICSGRLLLKKQATGYGGLAAQSCKIGEEDVTVIYGHLKLTSIQTSVGGELTAGQTLGILGKGYSSEADGERKHLHLGIDKGTSINIKGYAAKQSDLSEWLDPQPYIAN